mgnify:CR=1 FL=1
MNEQVGVFWCECQVCSRRAVRVADDLFISQDDTPDFDAINHTWLHGVTRHSLLSLVFGQSFLASVG